MNVSEEATCSLQVSGKDYRHLDSIQRTFVPLVMKFLKQISEYSGLYNKNAGGSLLDFLAVHDVAISFEREGFQLMKLCSKDAISYTTLWFNEARICAELHSSPQGGRSLFSTAEKHFIVHNLSAAIRIFRDTPGWPTLAVEVEKEPTDLSESSEAASEGDSMVPGEEDVGAITSSRAPTEVIGRKHFQEEMKDDRGVLTAMWWEHGALKALVQMVLGLEWSRNSEVFELARRSTEALLSNERVGSPVAETFIESIKHSIREKGTECLAVYKLLLAVLDIPAVKQAALKLQLMNTLMSQYQMMTQDCSSTCSSISSRESLDDMCPLTFNHSPELQTTATLTQTGDDGTHVLVHTGHSSSPDGLWTATPTSSAPHLMLTGSEGTISTLSLELAETSWGGNMRTASPANSSRHTSHPSDLSNKPDVPRLTFYWLKNPDVAKHGAGQATRTTIGLPDGRAIVVDDPNEAGERSNGLPPPGSRSAHVCKLTAGPNTTTMKKCNFDRVIARTVHAWAVPNDEPEDGQEFVAFEIKCTILEALLGFSPLNMGDERTQFGLDVDNVIDGALSDAPGHSPEGLFNPSKLVVTELLAPTWQVFPGEQPPVRRGPGNRGGALALAVVHEYACRPPQGVQSLDVPGIQLFMPQDQTGGSYHTLVGGVRNRLSHLMSDKRRDACVLEEAVSLINLLRDFVASSPAPAQAQLVAYSCSDTFVRMETALFKSQRAALWTIPVRRVFHALLELFKSMLERAADDVLWDFLIGSLLERSQWMKLVKDYSKVVLLSEKMVMEHDTEELACLRCVLWSYFRSLVTVVSYQREGTDGYPTMNEYQQGAHSFGRDSLDHVEFLVTPETGLAPKVLSRSSWTPYTDKNGVYMDLHVEVLSFLRTLFSVPRNNFVAQNDVSMYYLDSHWSSFKKLYQGAAACNSEVGIVARLHLQVVKAMMSHHWTHVYYQVKRLGILELLADEISLERREHSARKLAAFLPPGSSLVAKKSMNELPRQLVFPGTGYMVTEGEPGGKRYVESVLTMDSHNLHGIDNGALAPLQEATEDENRLLNTMCSSKSSVPSGTRGSSSQGHNRKVRSQHWEMTSSTASRSEVDPIMRLGGRGGVNIMKQGSHSVASCDKKGSSQSAAPKKVAGATDGRKVYRRKGQEQFFDTLTSDAFDSPRLAESRQPPPPVPTKALVDVSSLLYAKPSQIPSLRASKRSSSGLSVGSLPGENPGASAGTATIDGIISHTPLSLQSDELPSTIFHSQGSSDAEFQQMLKTSMHKLAQFGQSRIPRVPKHVKSLPTGNQRAPASGRGNHPLRKQHEAKKAKGSKDSKINTSTNTQPALKEPDAIVADANFSKEKIALTLRQWTAVDPENPSSPVVSGRRNRRVSPRPINSGRGNRRNKKQRSPGRARATIAIPPLMLNSGSPGPSEPTPAMHINGKGGERVSKPSEDAEKGIALQDGSKKNGNDGKKSIVAVPSLDLSVIGVQQTSKLPVVGAETPDPLGVFDSSSSSSEMWSNSDSGFQYQSAQSNEPQADSQNTSPDPGATADHHPDSGEPHASYRTPCSDFASEGDTSGPPTFGLFCRARCSRETPPNQIVEKPEANFDFGRLSAQSNRVLESDGATSFVPPSDFEYTGDMSDDAQRLLSLERKYYGYTSSEGTLSVVEMVSPSMPPVGVPPIHFPIVGGPHGVSNPQSFTSSRTSPNSRKKLHRTPSQQTTPESRRGSVLSKRRASGSRASMTEMRRSLMDRPYTVMDTRSTLDTYGTIHQSRGSFQIPDDFEWTGDVSDDCRRLEALERRQQRKGGFISSSSGFSMCDTMSEDTRMSPVSLLGLGPRRSSMSAAGGHVMARPSHVLAAKSRPSSATPYEVGGPTLRRPGRTHSVTTSRSRYQNEFDGPGDFEDSRWRERGDHHNILQTLPAGSGWTGMNFWGDSRRKSNMSFLPLDPHQSRPDNNRRSSSVSGYIQGSPGCFLSSKATGGKHGGKFRGDGLNESPRIGPRPYDVWNQASKSRSQATASSQRSVHYSAMQWKLGEGKKDSVGESEVNRLLSVNKARRQELEASKRKKPKISPMLNGPLCLATPKETEKAPAQESSSVPSPYAEARRNRAVYKDHQLHTVVLEVLLEGVLLEEGTRVHRDDEMDEDTQKIVKDLPMTLLHHLNHDCAKEAIFMLRECVFRKGVKRARLLRLLVRSLFPADLYKSTKRMAKGAFAHVHQCSLPVEGGPETCAVKVVDLPGEGTDEKSLLDLYSEVSILELFHGKPCVCQLFDYGITQEAAFLVMQEYKCSLLEWRHQLPKSCPNSIRLFFQIFRNIVEAVKVIHDHNVVHFDLKCSNILLEPLPGVSEADTWSPPTEEPPFRVVIADFGEARSYSNSWEARTVRNRGTEFNKSPEMLKIADALKRDLPEFDRRKRPGAGPPSDVWALGCLLFELVTGQMLQYDDDWARFFVRVTRTAMPVVSEERLSLLDPQSHAVVIDLLEFMLVRDQSWRPSLTMLLRRLDTVLNTGKLPYYRRVPSRFQAMEDMLSPINRYPAICMFGDIGEWHSDVIRLTDRHLLTSLNVVRDPWILAKHNISIVVLVSGGVVTSDTGAIRAAAARTNIELLEINVGSSESHDGVQDEHIKVLLNSGRTQCMGLCCEPAYKRQLVTIMQKLLEGEHKYKYYEGVLDVWRRLKY